MPLAPNDFVHLHVHSEYSLLDGGNRIGPMLEFVKEIGQEAIALTDHGVLFGALEFYNKAKKAGVKPIVGCEVYITPTDRKLRGPREKDNTHHLLLLAENFQGYQNICKLSSIGHTEGFYYKPRIDFDVLSDHLDGVIATSSCLAGLIPQALMDNDVERASELSGQFTDLFGKERFFIELMDHGIREQSLVNSGLLEIAQRQDLKLIATNDCHYMTKSDAEIHDVLLCVQTGARLSDEKRFRFHAPEFYVKSTAEMEKVFHDLPHALTNTKLVTEMCNLVMPEREYRLPKFPCPEGVTEAELMTQDVWEGAEKLYGRKAKEDENLRERIQFEIDTIVRMGFPSYFLIVADFINHARSIGIPVGPGRGSAAGSVVAYSLGITQLDPIEHGLLFERFLNPDRLSMPDIDIDFCYERRGEVIDYVRHKYGDDCVASIITFGTMKAKAAIRDVGRVLDLPLDVVDRVAKAIPNDLKMTLPKAMEESPDLNQMVQQDAQIAKLMKLATRVEGMVRHASTHAAGIIISDQPLTEYCPLYKAPSEDRAATQFTMTECEEELGLLKMDFLGIKNLTIIERVVRWLEDRQGIVVDWDNIRMDDPKTFESLQQGHTLGVFQLESSGMTALVKRLAPTEFADLTALLALFRPGPLGAGMHDMYVNRKHKREKVVFDHEVVKPILEETYGVILYQEQVMRISMAMSGFTRGEADKLRKAMGKKKHDVMAQMKDKWVNNAPDHSGVPTDLAEKIWNDVVSFASYGFNKSHSAAYAVVTFRTAYLRAHYPTEFMAALLTNEISGGTSDAIHKYINDCRDIHLDVRPVNINRSREYFNPDGEDIWFALNGVKGVGTGFAKTVVEERDENGAYESLQDFCMRVPREVVNTRVMETLIKIGGFDEMEPNRAALLAVLPEIMQLAADVQRQKESGQDDMFAAGDGDESENLVPVISLPDVPFWETKERAEYEKEHLGFYLSDHPLKRFEVELTSFADLTAGQIDARVDQLETDERVRVNLMGFVSDITTRTDKNNNLWAIVELEDLTGSYTVKAFARQYEAFRNLLQLDAVLQIEATLESWKDSPSLIANQVRDASELRAHARGLEIEWDASKVNRQALFELSEVCKKFKGSKPVVIFLRMAEGERASFHPNGQTRIALTPEAVKAVQDLPGKPSVRYIPGRLPTEDTRARAQGK